MRAVLVEQFGVLPTVQDVAEPACPPDGVVVRVEATGLCRSDWHAFMGHDTDITPPHVPGHELAGLVAEVGERVTGWAVGDRVTAPFVNACGTCAQCLDGDHQVCARQTQPGFSRWGSYAELVVVDHADVNLVAVPEAVDLVTAASLGCRFATSYRGVLEVGRLQAGQWVAVHGSGGVGLSAVMIARAAGARVVAVDVRPEPLELAQRSGAELVVQSSVGDDPMDVAARVRAAVLAAGGPADGVHLALDALGSPATCAASIASLRPRGRHVQVGLLLPADGGWPSVPMHLVVSHELEVLGTHGISPRSYPTMLAMVTAGLLRPGDLVTRTIGLDETPEALVALGDPATSGVGLTVIRP